MFFSLIRAPNQFSPKSKVVDLLFLYNFYFGQISSCCAKILVLGAPKLNLFCPKPGGSGFGNRKFRFCSVFCPKTRRFRFCKPEVSVLPCFTYSGAHTGDCGQRRALHESPRRRPHRRLSLLRRCTGQLRFGFVVLLPRAASEASKP